MSFTHNSQHLVEWTLVNLSIFFLFLFFILYFIHIYSSNYYFIHSLIFFINFQYSISNTKQTLNCIHKLQILEISQLFFFLLGFQSLPLIFSIHCTAGIVFSSIEFYYINYISLDSNSKISSVYQSPFALKIHLKFIGISMLQSIEIRSIILLFYFFKTCYPCLILRGGSVNL